MIRIKSGTYRNVDVSDQVFELVEPFKVTAKGGFVTVKNNNKFPGFSDDIRIKVPSMAHYEYVGDDESVVITVEKNDDEAMDEIRQCFEVLDDMTRAVCNGDVRALIVSGPPGVGKSFGIEKVIEPYCLFDHISGKHLRAEVVKGSATALGLYKTLYTYREQNNVLVFDDCDTILFDDVSLNLLKGALDSGKKRKISWLAESRTLKDEGIPNSFEFNGGVIFITNLKFDKVKGHKIKEHLDALQSRCHYLDLTLDSMRDKLLRIKQVARDCGLFDDMNLTPEEQVEVIEFMDKNHKSLREMSLRMAIKVAQLRNSFPKNWETMASRTCMKGIR
jgi:hypothetical protein